jgi:uncharacterized membrane protein HdeD (DUF308 family)
MSNIISKIKGTVKNWWVFLIIGVLLIIASVWIFRTPIESFINLAKIFSILILISGVFSIIFAFTNKDQIENWGLYLIGGILDVIVGIILLSYPGITLVVFSLFIGFWLMFRGFNIISTSLELKKVGVTDWGWILFTGILITIFAFMSIINPVIGASYLVFTLAFAIFLLGIANIFLSVQLRKVKTAAKEITG